MSMVFCAITVLAQAQVGSPPSADVRKAAESGNAAAQTSLGDAYYFGRGVPKDPTEAAGWYRKAAEQGDAYAQVHLGVAYDKGEGVTQDSAEAVRWYRKAAEQGDPFAEFNLGLVNVIGRAVTQDYAETSGPVRRHPASRLDRSRSQDRG